MNDTAALVNTTALAPSPSTQFGNTLPARDQKSIWHPFTQHGLESEFLPVKTAKGAYLYLDDGRTILDAISSWWVNLHGHAHPDIAQAIFTQANQLEHVVFAGFTHEPAVALAEVLLTAAQACNPKLSRCFYSDNGSTAVEVALKMAYQYHKNRGVKTRSRFLSLNHAYHGDTLGGMMVSARHSYHSHFAELLPQVDFIEPHDLSSLQQLLQNNPEQYAALIVEPMIQAAGGMRMYTAESLAAIASLCQQAGVLLICDEVFTGFYRTGRCFAFEHAGIQPDLVCLAKGLTGGFLPLAVTLATTDIFAAYQSEQIEQAFLHGHSFTANPLACAAALSSWQLLHNPSTQAAIQRISQHTQQWITRLAKHPQCQAARCLGTVGAVQLHNLPGYFSTSGPKMRAFALAQGVLLRPLGSVLYSVPPYCVNETELNKIYTTIEAILNNIEAFI